MSDRLAEIERRMADADAWLDSCPITDAQWLIGEVKRLRKVPERTPTETVCEHLEQAIALLEQMPSVQARLWREHLVQDLKSLKLLALHEQTQEVR